MNQYNLFIKSIDTNNLEVLNYCLESMKSNDTVKIDLLGEEHNQSALHLAVLSGRTEVVDILLKIAEEYKILKQVLLNQSLNGYTPLHYAIVGKLEFSYMFHGTDRGYADIERETPIIIRKILESAKKNKILKAVLKAKDCLGRSALNLAYRLGNKQIINEIQEILSDTKELFYETVNQKTDSGENALHEMARNCNAEQARELIKSVKKAGFLKEALLSQDKEERTPLHRAAYWNNVDVCKEIVKAATELGMLREVVTARAQYYITPLYDAVMFNNKEADDYLNEVSEILGLTAKDYEKFEEYKGPIDWTPSKTKREKKLKYESGCNTRHVLSYLE